MSMPADTARSMREAFGVDADFLIRAPGRVNLIGEHTDYNGGFVLPCAIDFFTEVAFCRRREKTVRVLAADYDGKIDTFDLTESLDVHPSYAWANYARGVIDVVQRHTKPLASGFDLVVSGNVPQGAGLSSSASYEVAVAKALVEGFALPLDEQEIALLAQRAENEFVGCKCGIMDQLICAVGEANAALLIDCRSLATKVAPMPPDWAIVIVDSKVKRGLVDSKYNERRQQCEQAAAILGVNSLRDATEEQLEAARDAMDEVIYRRARHVIGDSRRAVEMAAALTGGDMAAIHRMMAASHRSMREDFAITHPHVDTLVALIAEVLGEGGGVRMTGGGFGGCVVALLAKARVDVVREVVLREYPARTGLTPDVFVCTARQGVRRIDPR